MKTIPEQSGKDRSVVNVSILLTIALCIGIYLIITTFIIAKDGVTFIKYAQKFETAPIRTMENEFQHPGYPMLILLAHKATRFLHQNISILSWIYCGQSIALVFRLLALIILYFIGRRLLGARLSFWGVLILILLPGPAEYGSDALSDWPHLFFLVTGVLLLLKGAINARWWLFGFAGLAAGAGYLVRPECAQLVVLGGLWLGLQLLWSKRTMRINNVLSASALLLVGFLVIAAPYMNLKGAIFPKKNIGRFAGSSQQPATLSQNNQFVSQAVQISKVTPTDTAKAFGKVFENIGETLMWFFVPAFLIGMHVMFKTRKWHKPEQFFVIAIIFLNIPVMVWLYCRHGYISDRHTLPLLIIPILYVPVGLQELAIWCRKGFSWRIEPSAVTSRDGRFWFLVLFLVGVFICTPKLLRPIRIEKQGYRAAANWLKANTDIADTVAVPDERISFYAQRQGLVYENENIPANAVYTVKISKNQEYKIDLMDSLVNVEYEYVAKSKRGFNVIIFKNL